MGERRSLEAAVRVGLRRAAAHVLKAGGELVAGVGAFIDEIVRVRRDVPRADGGGAPTRIPLE